MGLIHVALDPVEFLMGVEHTAHCSCIQEYLHPFTDLCTAATAAVYSGVLRGTVTCSRGVAGACAHRCRASAIQFLRIFRNAGDGNGSV